MYIMKDECENYELVDVEIDEALYQKLNILSAKEGMTIDEYTTMILEKYIAGFKSGEGF